MSCRNLGGIGSPSQRPCQSSPSSRLDVGEKREGGKWRRRLGKGGGGGVVVTWWFEFKNGLGDGQRPSPVLYVG